MIIIFFLLIILLFVCIRKVEYALAFFMPMYMLLPNVSILGINLVHLVLLEIILGAYLKKKGQIIIKRQNSFLKLYAVYIILISLFTSYYYMSMGQYLSNIFSFLLDYILIGLLFNRIRLQDEHILFFNRILYVSTAIVVLYAFYNFFTLSNPYRAYIALKTKVEVDISSSFQSSQRAGLQGRVSSTFAHPLQLGQCILLISSYLIYQLKDKCSFIVKVAIILVLFLVSFFTGSRSSIIPMLLVLFLYLFKDNKFKVFRISILIVSLLVTTIIVIPQKYQENIAGMLIFWEQGKAEQLDIQGSSVDLRVEQFHSMQKILGADILWGRGKGYVYKEGDKHPEMLGYESIVYTEIFDNGCIGLIVFLVFYIALYLNLLSYAKNKYNKLRVHSLCLPFILSSFLTGMQYGVFIVFIVLYVITGHVFYNEEIKKINNDTQKNTLLLAK